MKELDCVEIIVEKEKYAREGVHQGMQGWICDANKKNASWLVNFPQCGENPDIATLPVKEEDLNVISAMQASINEKIKARFEEKERMDNLSDYII
ncbi:MAG: hypothetical protein Q4A80_05190 [Bacillota bacterium]|nr:hypothetical protein [Bacillota bacterium]